ncbi:DUF2141 domain-containing protein [Glacieibacterium frigidum]|uniref:DUF2141 domain-containing protein n=1 Tax=Glacieibacterium frigidum TaxID=2593303 RepID=A0A552U704_9SPHN|nr:DUF2141 domain-containing protein [Glacieibacterium frigidum]TRW13998.1 DUF2141 domain-containing protein [Glacieibacterium frigidum]
MMKRFAILAAIALAAPATAGDVTVTLNAVEARPGMLIVSLFDRATLFRAKPPYFAMVKPVAGTVTATLKDVAAGDYVLAVTHDANGDFQLGMSASGAPTEGWAMSNADKLRGPPDFDVIKVAVPAAGATLTETMVYPKP